MGGGGEQLFVDPVANGLVRGQAVAEAEVTPISRPEVDVTATPDAENAEGPVAFTAEFDVRPTIELPDYKGLKVTVEPAQATEEDEQKALDALPGVTGAQVHFETQRIEVDHDPQTTTAQDLVEAVAKVGYTARLSAF